MREVIEYMNRQICANALSLYDYLTAFYFSCDGAW